MYFFLVEITYWNFFSRYIFKQLYFADEEPLYGNAEQRYNYYYYHYYYYYCYYNTIKGQDSESFVWYFCLWKIISFQSPHDNFETLTLPSKSHRDEWQENLSQARLFQILDPLLFSNIFFSISSQAFLWRETETGAYQRFLPSSVTSS